MRSSRAPAGGLRVPAPRLRMLAAAALVLAWALPARAQTATPAAAEPEYNLIFGEEPSGPAVPAPRAADGHPDLSGYWKGTRATHPVGNIGKDLPGFRLPLTPAGEAALHHNLTATLDPESVCIIGGIPRHDASALPFEIVQNASRVVFLYLYTYFREIPIDGRKHDEDPDPSFFGDKVGHWEGDALVIDSIAFKGEKQWIDENGNPQSPSLHAVERWTRPDRDHIHVDVTIEDPEYYTRAFTYQRTWVAGRPGEILHEYSCSENNRDLGHLTPGPGPIKPDGQRDNFEKPLPDNPPGPEFYEQQQAAPARNHP